MNTSTATINKSKNKPLTADDLWAQITVLQKALDELKSKVLDSMAAKHGSQAWWEKETKKGLKELSEGKGKTFESIEKLEKHLGL